MVGQSEKVVLAMAWLDRMVGLGERVIAMEEATLDDLLNRELVALAREVDAEDELGDAVEELLVSGFLPPDREDSFEAAMAAAVDAAQEEVAGG